MADAAANKPIGAFRTNSALWGVVDDLEELDAGNNVDLDRMERDIRLIEAFLEVVRRRVGRPKLEKVNRFAKSQRR
jgi:hypothetical protein